MINADAIEKMKDHVVILNFARDLLVDEEAVVAAIEAGKVHRYVSDFPNPTTVGKKGVIVTPHLGASTVESEDNCAVMAIEQVMDYLENGNITNSVNYPSVIMPRTAEHRIVILHRNIPNMISIVSSTLARENINIENMANRSKGDYACTLIDTASEVSAAAIASIREAEGIIRVLNAF